MDKDQVKQNLQTLIDSGQIKGIRSDGVNTNAPIKADDIKPTQAVNVPNVAPQSSGQTIDQISAEVQAQKLKAEKAVDTSKQTFENRIKEITNVMGSRESMEKEAGLDQAQLDVSDIRSQIEAREHSLRRAIEDTQRTAGLSGTQISRRVSALNRDAARELADLSIIEGARLRRFDSISTNIDRKIKAKLEPLQFQLQFDQMFYQENRQAMTSAQDKAFQMRLMQEDRNYQEKMREQESIKNIALSAAQYGATGEQIKQITDAKNFNDAMQVGGSFLGEGFRMQVEAQKFNQMIQTAQLGLARDQLQATKDAAINAAAAESRKIAREDIELARKDPRVQAFETVQGLYNRVNEELSNVVDEKGQVNWESAAQSNSTIWALANAAARSQNPEMTRAVGDLGLTGTASVEQKIEAMYNKLLKDATANPGKLREMYGLLDSSHTSSLRDLNDAIKSFQVNVPGFELGADMFVNRQATADALFDSFIQNAEVMNAPAEVSNKQNDDILSWTYGYQNPLSFMNK